MRARSPKLYNRAMRYPRIGFALSGGSAKGLAHIGVIKALDEAKIRAEVIAGTSMGALVAAFYARGTDIDEMERLAHSIDRRQLLRLIDPSLQGGLIAGRKVYEFFESHLKGATFESCRIPLFIVATDLRTSDPVVLDEGEIMPALRASIALPPVLNPVVHRGLLLADGGLSVPLPARIARERGADIVIAVDVLARRDLQAMDDIRGMRGLVNVANASLEVMMHHLGAQDAAQADIVIAPDVSMISAYQFDQAHRLIGIGYEAGKEAVPRIKEIIAAKTPLLLKLADRLRGGLR